VHVITRKDAAQDIDAILSADLTADISHTKSQATLQHFVPILRRPYDVIAVVENAVLASIVLLVTFCAEAVPTGSWRV